MIAISNNIIEQQNAYIQEHYNIVWQHPEALPEDWNTFLLEELHEDSIQQINSVFVSRFAKPGSVLLIEACKALEHSTNPEEEGLGERFIDASVISPENRLGWDANTHEEIKKLSAAYTVLEGTVLYRLYCSKAHWPSPRTMKEIIERIIKSEAEVPQFWSEIVHPFLQKKILPLADEADKIFEVDPLDTEEELTNTEYFARHLQREQQLEQVEALRQQACANFAKKLKKIANTFHAIMSREFPERTKKMIYSLENVHSYVTGEGQVYLMGGCMHLRTHPDLQKDPNFSLQPLYDFLKDKKQIVILEPKVIAPWYDSPQWDPDHL